MVLDKATKRKCIITLVLDGFDPRPTGVYIGPPVYRKGKMIPQIDLTDKQKERFTLLQIPIENIPQSTLEDMIRKAWEEGFYDEGVQGAPWFPLLGQVINLYMFVDSASQMLRFLPGCEPQYVSTESFVYAEQLLLESVEDHPLLSSLASPFVLQEGKDNE